MPSFDVVSCLGFQTKNYGLRFEHANRDEIGRVAGAVNGMLAELAAAHERDVAHEVRAAEDALGLLVGVTQAASSAGSAAEPGCGSAPGPWSTGKARLAHWGGGNYADDVPQRKADKLNADWEALTKELHDPQRVLRRLGHRLVPLDGRDPEHLHLGAGQREHERDHIVVARVAIDQNRNRHQRAGISSSSATVGSHRGAPGREVGIAPVGRKASPAVPSLAVVRLADVRHLGAGARVSPRSGAHRRRVRLARTGARSLRYSITSVGLTIAR